MSKREEFCDEIRRLKKARSQTNSVYLKKDYDKSIRRMIKELAQYDLFQKGITK